MPNTSSASASANTLAARRTEMNGGSAKGAVQGKYTPVHKRPTPTHAPASNYSQSSSSSSSSSSGSRSSSPTPSTISSMSSAPSSPRSASTKPTSVSSSRASSKSPPASNVSSPKPRSKAPKAAAISFQPGEPPIYTPSQLFSMRPLALESVKERMKIACPEVTMNRRMRKGLEFAAGAARRAAREASSGSSTSPSVSGSSARSTSGSSRGTSSGPSSSVASTSPSATGSEFDSSELDDARFLEESILEEDDEARSVIATQAEEYIPPPAPASFAAPPKRQPTGRKPALPRDLPDNSWRALKRLGVPVTAV